jgi:hypothetical protein
MFMGQFSVSRQILNFIIIIKISAQVIIIFQKIDKIKNSLIYAKIIHVLWYSSPVFKINTHNLMPNLITMLYSVNQARFLR